ncbi:MAG: hypothetical protein WCL07_00920 [bacterium]
MNKISFVYFDVGGVLIKDFSATNKWQEMKQFLGVPPDKDQLCDQLYDKYEPAANEGKIDIDSLMPELEQKLDIKFPPNFSLRGYMTSKFSPNLSLWPILDSLQPKYKLGLLTNMYPNLLVGIEERGLLPSTVWDQIVDSSIAHAYKPELEIYNIAQASAGVPHNEILFIDNLSENLEPAKSLGWTTFLYDPRNYEESSQALATFLRDIL